MRTISLALLLALATGCGAAPSTAPDPAPMACATERPTGTLDTKVLYQTEMDYPPFDTPEALAREAAELVVMGRVTGWLPGPVIEEIPDSRTYHVLLRVRVERRLKGSSAEVVHFPYYQGALLSARKPFQDEKDFERAVPTGTRVLLFLKAARPSGYPVVEDRAGLPPGTPDYAAAPQGVVLHEVGPDGRGRAVGGRTEMLALAGWDEPCGIDGLVARLEANGFTG
ncbi:hypothetical protein [Nonomuraea rubra]|uniref:Lipoprotein n=2 Tax=Nonomuraea rubra TaxID=46180 RepID=A0A7X0TW66_9ACTN|nr:hypothetical protein [Nonomuraea rubra]MBB6546212.1 hypothetical protein [Nonomuraea rubra]